MTCTPFDAALDAARICTCDGPDFIDDPECPRHGTDEARVHAILEAAAPLVRRMALHEAISAVRGIDAVDSALLGTDAALHVLCDIYKDVLQ